MNSRSLARHAVPVDVQPAGCFSFDLCFGGGIRRSSSPRSGIFFSICSEMRLRTLRQKFPVAASACSNTSNYSYLSGYAASIQIVARRSAGSFAKRRLLRRTGHAAAAIAGWGTSDWLMELIC